MEKLRELWRALEGQFPLLRKGWLMVVVVAVVAVATLFAKDFFGGLGKNAADRVLPVDKTKPAEAKVEPPPAAIPELAVIDVDLLDPQRYFRWSGTTFSAKELSTLKSYYDDETWSASGAPGAAGPPKLYQDDERCVRTSLRYLGSVALGLANRAQVAALRRGKLPSVEAGGSVSGDDADLWQPLLTDLRASILGATFTPAAILKEAARLATAGAAGIKLNEKSGGASPTLQLIVENKGAAPDIITGVSSFVASASGHATVGGSEEYEAGPLKLTAAASVKFDSHHDQSAARLEPPIIVPPHGYARLAVRLDPGSLFSAALGHDSARKRKLSVEYGEDVTTMVFGGLQVQHGTGTFLKTPVFCVSYLIAS